MIDLPGIPRLGLQMVVLRSLLGVVVGIGLAACLQPDATVCGNGGVCPPNLRCADVGASQICVPRACGNGRVDDGELCDDGNNTSSDGCSFDCISPETCGTGVVDPTEECDDSNLRSHDGCSSQCTLETHGWISTADSPTARAAAALAYDRRRNVLVMSGGTTMLNGLSRGEADTWEWDGVVWRTRKPRTVIPPHKFSHMVFDEERQRTVLLVTYDQRSETWEWDGVDWKLITTDSPIVFDAELVYDPKRKRTLYLGETSWVYDGAWTELVPGIPVRGRVAYDRKHDRFVALTYGPTTVWLYSESAGLTSLQPPDDVGGTSAHVVYDERRGVVVFVTAFQDAQVWELDGTTWRQGPSLQGERLYHEAVFDTTRGTTLVFGGSTWTSDQDGNTHMADLLEYDGQEWRHLTTILPDIPLEPATANTGVRPIFSPRFGGLHMFDSERHTWSYNAGRWSPTLDHPSPSARTDLASVVIHASPFEEQWLVFGGKDGTSYRGESWLGVIPPSLGLQWSQAQTGPSARAGASMAYDPNLGRVILFGGERFGSALDETWEWTFMSGWTQRTPATVPPARTRPHMAFDAALGAIVMFGGENTTDTGMWKWNGATWEPVSALAKNGACFARSGNVEVLFGARSGATASNETWQLFGSSWTQRTPEHSPPAMATCSATYNPTQSRLYLYGQAAGQRPSLWSWNGTDWSEHPIKRYAPDPQTHHAQVFDEARRETVLLASGYDSSDQPVETWTWSHRNGWRLHDVGPQPPAYDVGMTYDPLRERVVVFGDGQTWEWNGITWQHRIPVTSPPSRSQPVLAWDGASRRVLLVGGVPDGSTWHYDGTTWTRVADFPATTGLAATFDAVRQRVVTFGGIPCVLCVAGEAPVSNQLSEWDGTAWIDRTSALGPPARSNAAMVFDPTRGHVVIVGGDNDGISWDDAWEWTGEAWLELPDFSEPRTRASASYDPESGSVTLFGGTRSLSSPATDAAVWFERSEDPTVRHEVCVAGNGDIDVDGLADCADDDCALVCQ